MKERPILFNADMVRAIIDGRKTQTRRVYKGIPPTFYPSASGGCWGIPVGERKKSPFGTVGDRLWVRETFRPVSESDTGFTGIEFRAGGMPDDDTQAGLLHDGTDRWRPSIHMPRWASRIDLEITAVRVERVQEITEEDAKAEGVTCPYRGEKCGGYHPGMATVTEPPECVCIDGYKPLFKDLWDSIYGNWDENPFVWVYEFRRVK
jgi:hypothetical protein